MLLSSKERTSLELLSVLPVPDTLPGTFSRLSDVVSLKYPSYVPLDLLSSNFKYLLRNYKKGLAMMHELTIYFGDRRESLFINECAFLNYNPLIKMKHSLLDEYFTFTNLFFLRGWVQGRRSLFTSAKS